MEFQKKLDTPVEWSVDRGRPQLEVAPTERARATLPRAQRPQTHAALLRVRADSPGRSADAPLLKLKGAQLYLLIEGFSSHFPRQLSVYQDGGAPQVPLPSAGAPPAPLLRGPSPSPEGVARWPGQRVWARSQRRCTNAPKEHNCQVEHLLNALFVLDASFVLQAEERSGT